MLIKVLKARIKEMKMYLIMDAVVWIIGIVLLALVLKTDDEPTSFEIGTLLIVMVTALFTVFTGAFSFKEEFNKAVGMGVARRQFVPAYFATSIIFICIQYGIACLSHIFEVWEINTFWSSYEKETGVEAFMYSKYVIIIIVAAALIQLLGGSCMLKFGKKAYFVLAMGWMIFCLAQGQIGKAIERNDNGVVSRIINNICDFIVKYADSWMIVIGVTFMLICAGLTYLIIRKQQVTD